MNVQRRAQGESSRALNDWWAKPRQLGHHVGDATNLGLRQGLAVARRSRAWPSPRSDEDDLATGAPVLPVPDWALIRRMMAAEGRPFAWTGRAAVVAIPAVARLEGEAARRRQRLGGGSRRRAGAFGEEALTHASRGREADHPAHSRGVVGEDFHDRPAPGMAACAFRHGAGSATAVGRSRGRRCRSTCQAIDPTAPQPPC